MLKRTIQQVISLGGLLPVPGATAHDPRAYESSPYLSGNYGPVDSEVTATDLPVTGALPEDLDGRYLRNGPNPAARVNPARHHWFLGDGMVHGVRLSNGNAAWYRNRWIRSTRVSKALGDPATTGQPAFGPNTHVIGHAGRTWALVEAGFPPVELDEELSTIGVNRFFDSLPGGFTAHPKLDPDTGELHAISYWWPKQRGYVQYVRIGQDGRVNRSLDIPVPGMTMLHDMSITERYVVVYDLPVTVRMKMLLSRPNFPFAWNDDYGARVGLLPRDGEVADIVWIDVKPAYVFHPMNAYDDEHGNVVIDVCRYERMFAGDQRGPFGDSLPTLDRWVLNPTTRRASETRIDDRSQEFPRCNPAFNGKPYRYGYTAGIEGRGFPCIYKQDLVEGSAVPIAIGEGRHCGEPYFVPRAGASAEDDGYLMTYVYDQASDRSELVVLDAADTGAPAIARVHLPQRVPYGFHGCWVPEGASAV